MRVGFGTPITPALLTSTSMGPSRAAVAAARRTDASDDRSTTRSRPSAAALGRDRGPGLVELRLGAPGEHDACAAPGQLEGGVVAEAAEARPGHHDGAARLVAEVGEAPGLGAHGVVAIASSTLLTERLVAVDRDGPGSGVRRPPASTMKDSRSVADVTVGVGRPTRRAARRGRRR